MLRELLLKKKPAIVGGWVRLILDTYSSETSRFLRLQKDRFSNPVGYTISANIEIIFDEITGARNFSIIKSMVDDIIRIRAIQDFSPSQAVGFIFLLKEVVRGEIGEYINERKIFDELLDFELIIDRVGLIAFDSYQESKEKVFKIRIDEIKSQSGRN